MQHDSPPATPPAAPTPRPPRRLPDELVLLIVEWCAYFEDNDERKRTFAALCLVSRRYKPAAERHLYSRLTLTSEVLDKGATVTSAAQTLARRPELRQHVKSAAFDEIGPSFVEEHTSVAALFLLLPNIEELVKPYWDSPALACMLTSAQARIRRLVVDRFDIDADMVLDAHPQVFSALRELRVERLDEAAWYELPRSLRCIKTLAFEHTVHADNIMWLDQNETFFPPDLKTLSFPLRLVGDASSALDDCQQLHQLGVVGEASVSEYAAALPQLVKLLDATPPSVLSISIDARLRIYAPDSEGRVATEQDVLPVLIPSASTNLLGAIPLDIEHLSLVTNCFRAVDVAIYLLSTRRPRALKTLRIGGDVARGLGWILYGEGVTGRYAALRGQLERDGVVVTSVPSRW